MGTVYEAEQDNPRRTVALKVIRPGLVSPELVKRFSHEAQILARLQHPGIAQVYEAGMVKTAGPSSPWSSSAGCPWTSMPASLRSAHGSAAPALLAKRCATLVQHAHEKASFTATSNPATSWSMRPRTAEEVLDFGVAHVTAVDLLTTGQARPGRPTARHP